MAETIAQSGNENYAVSVGTGSAQVLVEGAGIRQSGSGVASRVGDTSVPRQVIVRNNGANALYIGWGSDTSVANGLVIPSGEREVFLMHFTDEMWAISVTGANDVRVSILHGKGSPA